MKINLSFWKFFAGLVFLFVIFCAVIFLNLNRYQVHSFKEGWHLVYIRYDKLTGKIQGGEFDLDDLGFKKWETMNKKTIRVRLEDVTPVQKPVALK